jgi:hypothetical protein
MSAHDGDGSLCKLANPDRRIDAGIVGLPRRLCLGCNAGSTDSLYQAKE